MVKIEDMLEVMEIGDKEKEFGKATGGTITYGFYIRAKKGTLLEEVENTARGKFKLENDIENYVQEARRVLFEKIKNYEENKRECNDGNIKGYLFKACQNELLKISQRTKGGTCQYDRSSGEYSVIDLLSMDATDSDDNYLYESEINQAISQNSKKAYSEFVEWFRENKQNILTKKQLAYLEDENTILPNHRARMNKTICERINKKYSDTTIIEERIKRIQLKIEVLKDILIKAQPRYFMLTLVKHMKEESWLVDEVYGLSFDTCKMITGACSDIKKYDCIEGRVDEIRNSLNHLHGYFSTVLDELEKKL